MFDVDRQVETSVTAALRARDTEEEALALLARGWCLAYAGVPDEAVAVLGEAAATFGRLGDRWHRALPEEGSGSAMPDPAQGLSLLARAADAFGETGDRVERANCSKLLGDRAAESGVALEAADRWLAEALLLAERTGNEHELLHAKPFGARLVVRTARSSQWADQKRCLASQLNSTDLLPRLRRLGDRRCVARCLLARGEAGLALGEDATEWLRSGLAQAREVGDGALQERARALLARGEPIKQGGTSRAPAAPRASP